MKLSTTLLALELLYLPRAIAWGDLGHNTTGLIASRFVSESTAGYLKDILGDDGEDYLRNVAIWADKFKKTRYGRFSGNFHFIDAHDEPDNRHCNVDYNRDCKSGGCIISALANYTEQAVDTSLDRIAVKNATMMLVHLLGDLTQPLHNEDVSQGGNKIFVLWNRGHQNLHHVWDTMIPEKYTETIDGHSGDKASKWANNIANEITHGQFNSEKKEWLQAFDFANPNGTAMIWSQEANQLVCTDVFPPGLGPSQIVGKQVGGEYYDNAGPVVEKQIARAGFRMAAWLDAVANEVATRKRRNQGGGEL